jgi:hypothetical protein
VIPGFFIPKNLFGNFCVFLGFTEHYEIVGISAYLPLTAVLPSVVIFDCEVFFHSMQYYVGKQGANDSTLGCTRLGFMKNPFIYVACFEPKVYQLPSRETNDGFEQVFVVDVVETSFYVGIYNPLLFFVRTGMDACLGTD